MPLIDATVNGAITAIAQNISLDVTRKSAATITLSGTWTGTIQFEAATDAAFTNPIAIPATPSGGGSTVTSATANGTWTANVSAYASLRVRSSAWTSGTATVAVRASQPSALLPVSHLADRVAQRIYNVKDFGATGDGSTDDSAAIQAVFNAAPAGSRIHFPATPNGYNLGGTTITVTKQLDIVGAGPRNTIIYQTGNVDAFAVNVAAQGGGSRIFNATISDLMLLAKTDQSAGAMLHLGNLGTLSVTNVTISNAGGGRPWDGVWQEDGANVLYERVQVAGCNINWHLEVIASSQNIIDPSWDGRCCGNSAVSHGMLVQNLQGGSSSIEGLHGAPGFTIYNNGGDGIHGWLNGAGSLKNWHFNDCIIDSNKGYGLWAEANTGFSLTNIFAYCDFSANGINGAAYSSQVHLRRVTNGLAGGNNVSLGGKCAVEIVDSNHVPVFIQRCYNNNQGDATNAGSDKYAVALLGTTSFCPVHVDVDQDTSRVSDPAQNGLYIASTVTDIDAIYLGYHGTGTAVSDNTDGTKRVRLGMLNIYNTNSDGTVAFRGLRVDTKAGGGLNDALRLTDTTNAKQAYLRCNNGRVEMVNSGFSAVVATIADQNGHRYKSQASVPTYAVGAAAGTSPTTAAMTGTDESMTATLTTGTATTTGATILTVTFAGAWDAAANNVQVIPKNSAAAATTGAAKPYVTNITTTGFILQSNTTALAISTQYVWGFVCS